MWLGFFIESGMPLVFFVPVNPSPFKTVSAQSAVGLHGATLQPRRG